MSLSMKHQAQLGNWGTIGILGEYFVREGNFSEVHFLVQIDCDPSEFQSHLAMHAKNISEEEFGNCAWLRPCGEECHRLTFTWRIKSRVSNPERLVRAASKRFRSTEEMARNSIAEDVSPDWIFEPLSQLI